MKTLMKSATFLSLSLTSALAMAECGNVVIAEMDWASAEFAANLDKIILEEGYGCSVDLTPGATPTTLASMESKGRPHIAPEFWSNSVRERLNKAVEEGKITISTKLIPDASEGWYVSRSIAEDHPEIETIDDVLARPDLFPNKEDPTKGQFVNCPSNWACATAGNNLATAYNFDSHDFIVTDPGSAAGLDGTIAKSYDREEGWFGYYWQPSAVSSKYEIKQLKSDADVNIEHWNTCIAIEGCENPQPTGFNPTTVNTIVVPDFASEQPEIMNYLQNRSYNSELVGNVLVYMSDNQASGEDGAFYFLEKFENIWSQWVSAEAADKIRKAIN